jgi:hypothetical protein
MIRSSRQAVCALLLVVSGCASIASGTSQNVTVNSMPPGAQCEIRRDGAAVQSGITPMTISIDKSRRPISVSCADGAGRQGIATGNSGLEPWFFGNLMIGGLVGMSIDLLDGAVNKYDSPVWVSLGGATSQPLVAVDRARPSVAGAAVSDTTAATARETSSRPVTVVTASTASAALAPSSPTPVAPVPGRREFLAKAADVSEATSVALRMNAPRGVVLLDVLTGGAAASSGLLPGDVILAFNGAPVEGVAGLAQDLGTIPKGGRAQINIWRKDAERSLTLRF